MDITLMGDIEYKRIFRTIENPMKHKGQLDHSQVWPNVASIDRCNFNDEITDFLCKPGQLIDIQSFDVGRALDGRQ